MRLCHSGISSRDPRGFLDGFLPRWFKAACHDLYSTLIKPRMDDKPRVNAFRRRSITSAAQDVTIRHRTVGNCRVLILRHLKSDGDSAIDIGRKHSREHVISHTLRPQGWRVLSVARNRRIKPNVNAALSSSVRNAHETVAVSRHGYDRCPFVQSVGPTQPRTRRMDAIKCGASVSASGDLPKSGPLRQFMSVPRMPQRQSRDDMHHTVLNPPLSQAVT